MHIADAWIKYLDISWRWLHTNTLDSCSDFFFIHFLFLIPSNLLSVPNTSPPLVRLKSGSSSGSFISLLCYLPVSPEVLRSE